MTGLSLQVTHPYLHCDNSGECGDSKEGKSLLVPLSGMHSKRTPMQSMLRIVVHKVQGAAKGDCFVGNTTKMPCMYILLLYRQTRTGSGKLVFFLIFAGVGAMVTSPIPIVMDSKNGPFNLDSSLVHFMDQNYDGSLIKFIKSSIWISLLIAICFRLAFTVHSY